MLTAAQKKLIRSLDSKKGRYESGLCLVEGEKNVSEARGFIDFEFTPEDTEDFSKLVDTVTPQPSAAVARIPRFSREDIAKADTIVVLDGVQDPGNVGTILRLCLAFDASLILIESADPSSPKVVRSSAGAFFAVPWLEIGRPNAEADLEAFSRPIYRLEKSTASSPLLLKPETAGKLSGKTMIIAGSEGQGIKLSIAGTSLEIPHSPKLESLNVANALAIVLSQVYNNK